MHETACVSFTSPGKTNVAVNTKFRKNILCNKYVNFSHFSIDAIIHILVFRKTWVKFKSWGFLCEKMKIKLNNEVLKPDNLLLVSICLKTIGSFLSLVACQLGIYLKNACYHTRKFKGR